MLVYGHRGAAGEAPENTIAGALHAIERGARYIEIDLQLSADDQLVVNHDKTLRRTAGRWGKTGKYTASELAKMDAREDGPPWPRKKDCGIPTLEAMLRATDKLAGYQLEVKPDSKAKIERIAQHLSERFDTSKAAHKVVITSSSIYLHECLRDIAPHITRGMVITRADEVATLMDLGCLYSAMHWSACNPYTIRKLRKARIHISVWTVNDAQVIKNLYKMKVDSVITDYPSMAVPLIGALER
ncbi:MAG: glycerophosphodiester phosphodiesterase family protein [Halioglobus sp.]